MKLIARQSVERRAPSDFPYDHVKDYQNWRKAVTNVSNTQIDPHAGSGKFRVDRQSKIVSAGSCFAQRIAESLVDYGFNYHVVERGPAWLNRQQLLDYGYGVYSARYGNVYTTLQLLQLLQRSLGEFVPADDYWLGDGHYVDPFRPSIQPDGFASIRELQADREQHLESVAQLFRDLDLFVFTLGLTETWCSTVDNATFPTCPGKHFGEYSSERYVFRNLTLNENIEYMERFLAMLKDVNPTAKVLLTVSPVPLAATYEDRHVLQSTTYSKAVLRVLAEELRQRHDHVDYFASYEIITATYNNAAYFQADKRNVNTVGVDHVMNAFYRHFTTEAPETLMKVERQEEGPLLQVKICDEEELLNLMNADL
jgi:hypothetical protein